MLVAIMYMEVVVVEVQECVREPTNKTNRYTAAVCKQ